MTKEDKLDKIYSRLKYSAEKYAKLHKEIKDDFEFAQGKQWSDSDVETLREQGVDALTINKIKPIIKLLTGIERQSKSDFVAYPEGNEDGIKADIVTRLLKNVTKMSNAEYKMSEVFKHGIIGGVSYIEPYIDYSFDIVDGELKFKKISALNVFPDPDAKEYDLSDSKFLIKTTLGLSQDDLISLFPDKEREIKAIQSSKINLDNFTQLTTSRETFGYPRTEGEPMTSESPDGEYDLLDYYYKELQLKYFVADPELGILEEKESLEEAEQIVAQVPTARIIKRKMPVIMLCQVVGDKIMYEGQAWTYPSWKTFPIIPFFAEVITEDLNNVVHNTQGIVRSIKSLQREFNKRRTQELRHLNSSANSGFDIEEGQLSPEQKEHLKKFGSSPGFLLERKKGSPPVGRITPMPLSQGHAQLAEENAQDLKEASGVNPDLLANDSQSQSGRAILLKQRQGLVMVQEILDNFGQTKKLVGKFILSQFKEILNIQSAIKILGDSFVKENFEVPITAVLQRANEKMVAGEQLSELEEQVMLKFPDNDERNPVVDPMTNQLQMMIDTDQLEQVVNEVLNDTSIGKYDVTIGEGPFAETIQMSNFMEITDLAKQGIPIPPDVIIRLSAIPEGEKKEIILRMQQMAMQQANIPAQPKGSANEQV